MSDFIVVSYNTACVKAIAVSGLRNPSISTDAPRTAETILLLGTHTRRKLEQDHFVRILSLSGEHTIGTTNPRSSLIYTVTVHCALRSLSRFAYQYHTFPIRLMWRRGLQT